jgi:hypothetical protein
MLKRSQVHVEGALPKMVDSPTSNRSVLSGDEQLVAFQEDREATACIVLHQIDTGYNLFITRHMGRDSGTSEILQLQARLDYTFK